MASIYLLRDDGLVFQMDATTRIAISSDVTITKHPVETGATVSDHAQKMPRVITLYGVVSATPIAGTGVTGGGSRLRDALDTLEASVGKLFDVVDPKLGTFSSYMLSRYPTERARAAKLPFTIELTEVVFATAAYVTIAADDIADEVAASSQADAIDVGQVGGVIIAVAAAAAVSAAQYPTTAATTDTGGVAAAEQDVSDLGALVDWISS